MLLILAILFAIAWILGITVFKMASVAVHILLLVAVVALIAHMVSWIGHGGRRHTTTP